MGRRRPAPPLRGGLRPDARPALRRRRAHPVPSRLHRGRRRVRLPAAGRPRDARGRTERLRPAIQQPRRRAVERGVRLPGSRARTRGARRARRHDRGPCLGRSGCGGGRARDRSRWDRSRWPPIVWWWLQGRTVRPRSCCAAGSARPISSAFSVSPCMPTFPSAGTCTTIRASRWLTSPRASCSDARRPSPRRGTPSPTSSRSRRPRPLAPRPRSTVCSICTCSGRSRWMDDPASSSPSWRLVHAAR